MFGICLLLLVLGIGGIYILADQYEKRPKKPGEAELLAAEEFTRVYEFTEGSGNSPEAIKLAEYVARNLRVSRQFLFSEGRSDVLSSSKGRFLTYCHLKEDSVVFIVHVPGLRNFTDDAQLSLFEWVWSLASTHVASEHPNVTRLAIGVRGVMDYSAIYTGTIDRSEASSGIEIRHSPRSEEVLWPYFITPESDAGVEGE